MEEINERKRWVRSNVTTTKEKDWDGACTLSCNESLWRKNWWKALPCWWYETNCCLVKRLKRKARVRDVTKKDQSRSRSSIKQRKHSNWKVKSSLEQQKNQRPRSWRKKKNLIKEKVIRKDRVTEKEIVNTVNSRTLEKYKSKTQTINWICEHRSSLGDDLITVERSFKWCEEIKKIIIRKEKTIKY